MYFVSSIRPSITESTYGDTVLTRTSLYTDCMHVYSWEGYARTWTRLGGAARGLMLKGEVHVHVVVSIYVGVLSAVCTAHRIQWNL